jgi:hypothetical protein
VPLIKSKETIWTAAARSVPVLDQLDRRAPPVPLTPAQLAAYYTRLEEALRPFAPRRLYRRPVGRLW